MCIASICFPGSDFITFQINLNFLILVFHMTKMSRQKVKYLENEKGFNGEIKHFSSLLKGFQLSKIFSGMRERL